MRAVKPFLLLSALVLVVPALAQVKKKPSPTKAVVGTQRTLQAELEKKLKLTATQKKKWAEILSRYRPKVKAVQEKYASKLAELRKQQRSLSDKATAELKPTLDARRKELDAVLTPEQRKKKESLNAALKTANQRRAGNQKR